MTSEHAYLLDANALIALLWPAHSHHDDVLRWFKREVVSAPGAVWFTCPFTQAAFVRVVAQPAFHEPIVSVGEATALLSRNTTLHQHRYLAADLQWIDVMKHCTGGIVGHRQITDAWLITIAHKARAKLVSFDQRLHTLLATPAERERDLLILR